MSFLSFNITSIFFSSTRNSTSESVYWIFSPEGSPKLLLLNSACASWLLLVAVFPIRTASIFSIIKLDNGNI